MCKVETYLPVFTGHYEGYLQGKIDDTIESELEHYNSAEGGNLDINSDRIELDYPPLEESAGEYFTEKVKDELSEYVTEITYQSTYSPKFYNFGNDSINVSIEPRPTRISHYIYEERDSFASYVGDVFKTRQGFISFHPDTFKEWERDTDGFTKYSKNSFVLGLLLEFIALNEEIEESDLWEDFNCNGEVSEHLKLTDA